MATCVICETEFELSKKHEKKLFYGYDTDLKNQFMCEECWEQRAFASTRYFDGEMLCCNKGCGRSAMAFSKYCLICENEI